MKAISLWQPWASAIALGHKSIETRGWSTKYRGPLAIHAAKRWTRAEREFAAEERALGRMPERLPLGAVVATCDLVDVERAEDIVSTISGLERHYGDYYPGRFGWILQDVRALPEPIPATGKQGFWEWMPPEGFAL